MMHPAVLNTSPPSLQTPLSVSLKDDPAAAAVSPSTGTWMGPGRLARFMVRGMTELMVHERNMVVSSAEARPAAVVGSVVAFQCVLCLHYCAESIAMTIQNTTTVFCLGLGCKFHGYAPAVGPLCNHQVQLSPGQNKARQAGMIHHRHSAFDTELCTLCSSPAQQQPQTPSISQTATQSSSQMAEVVNEVQEKLDELAGARHAAHNSTASAAQQQMIWCELLLLSCCSG